MTATSCGTGAATMSTVPPASSVVPSFFIPAASGTTSVTTAPVYRFVASHLVGVSILNSHDPLAATSDASQLLPVSQWGTSYVVTTYSVGGGTLGPSEIAIVASAPATVTVTPSATTLAGGTTPSIPAFTPYTFNLAACEGIQIQAASDLTGTTVATTGTPVGMFVGDRCEHVPNGFNACDHLEEQLWPVSAGTRSTSCAGARCAGTSPTSCARSRWRAARPRSP